MLLEVSLLAYLYVLIHICDSFPAAGFQYLRTILFYMENNYYAVVCMLIHGDWKSTIKLRLINWYETRITIKIDRTFCSENKVRNETDYFHLKAEWNRHETIWTTTMEERKFSLSMTLAGLEQHWIAAVAWRTTEMARAKGKDRMRGNNESEENRWANEFLMKLSIYRALRRKWERYVRTAGDVRTKITKLYSLKLLIALYAETSSKQLSAAVVFVRCCFFRGLIYVSL